ncbi:hypothetical protein NM208_g8014 [Fusarium decemcellulare]|uniref:Uncharacterized protein n=1 Tax=Fusarium decemcellulare TaxID=57161 RepID=A0ACC1S7G4_9HYPO|nr:hypothetical protein NM208_g8014 [Fusarium decemcellulare]
MSLMMAGMRLVVNLPCCLPFWLHGQDVVYEDLSTQKGLTTAMRITMDELSFGNMAPNIQAASTGLVAASKTYSAIDCPLLMSPFDRYGTTHKGVHGRIALDGIKHIFPFTPDVVVTEDLSLTILAGKTTPKVGASSPG